MRDGEAQAHRGHADEHWTGSGRSWDARGCCPGWEQHRNVISGSHISKEITKPQGDDVAREKLGYTWEPLAGTSQHYLGGGSESWAPSGGGGVVPGVGERNGIRSCHALNGKSFEARWSSPFALITSSLMTRFLNWGVRTWCSGVGWGNVQEMWRFNISSWLF